MNSKFWRRNEKKVMKEMGLKPVPGSGSHWLNKEDGESEFVLAQLKSTKKASISLKLIDIKTLYENAAVVDKMPVFVLEFVHDIFPVKLVCFEQADAQKLLDMMHNE